MKRSGSGTECSDRRSGNIINRRRKIRLTIKQNNKIVKRLLIFAALIVCSLITLGQNVKKVAMLETLNGDKSVGDLAFELNMVRGELIKAICLQSGYRAFMRTDIDQLMKEYGFQNSGMVADAQRKRIGEMAGADFICVSKLTKKQSFFYIEAYLVDIVTGEYSVPATQYVTLRGNDYAELFEKCKTLAQELLGNVGPSVTTPPRTPVITPSIPSTPIADGNYNVNRNYNGFYICGNQRTDYSDVADALKGLADAVNKWGELRTGAILENGNGIVIYGGNGYKYMGFSADFSATFLEKLKKCHDEKEIIKDITVNSKGHYVIIYGNDYYRTDGLPESFLKKIKKSSDDDEDVIYSVSIDNSDNWAFVSKKFFCASNNDDYEFMREAKNKFGHIESVCITLKGIVVCCEKGVYFRGIPKKVVDKLIEFMDKGKIPKVIKYTDSGTCFITDGEKTYVFYM